MPEEGSKSGWKIPLRNAEINKGVELVPRKEYVDAIAVGDKIVFFVPPWSPDKWNKATVEALRVAFGGRIVRAEVIVEYKPTGKYYDPEDVKAAKKNE